MFFVAVSRPPVNKATHVTKVFLKTVGFDTGFATCAQPYSTNELFMQVLGLNPIRYRQYLRDQHSNE
jgi:hypothetical protein